MEVNKACPLASLRVRFAPQNCPIGYAICNFRPELVKKATLIIYVNQVPFGDGLYWTLEDDGDLQIA